MSTSTASSLLSPLASRSPRLPLQDQITAPTGEPGARCSPDAWRITSGLRSGPAQGACPASAHSSQSQAGAELINTSAPAGTWRVRRGGASTPESNLTLGRKQHLGRAPGCWAGMSEPVTGGRRVPPQLSEGIVFSWQGLIYPQKGGEGETPASTSSFHLEERGSGTPSQGGCGGGRHTIVLPTAPVQMGAHGRPSPRTPTPPIPRQVGEKHDSLVRLPRFASMTGKWIRTRAQTTTSPTSLGLSPV